MIEPASVAESSASTRVTIELSGRLYEDLPASASGGLTNGVADKY